MGLSNASSKEEEKHPFDKVDSNASVVYHSEASGGDHTKRPMPLTPQIIKSREKQRSTNKTVSFDNSTKVYSAVGGSDKTGDGSIENPYETLQRAWKHAIEIPSTHSRITVYGYYRGDRLYASAICEDNADFVAEKVAGMEFIDETIDKNGYAQYEFRVARDAYINLQLLRDKVMDELEKMNLLNHTCWHFDTSSRANNVEIWCPDQTVETASHKPSSPRKRRSNEYSQEDDDEDTTKPRNKSDLDKVSSLIPISSEHLYDELLKMGIGMAVGKITILEMISYVHDGAGEIFTLGGKKASLEFDALIRNVRQQGKLTTYA